MVTERQFGGIWKPDSVRDEPRTSMSSWEVFRTPSGDHHIVGYCGEGRVSSKIVKLDGNIATTRSGRKYRLDPHNEGAMGMDAQYVFQMWLKINGLAEADVTFIKSEHIII